MTSAEIAAWAALCWLLFPAIAVPVGLVARRRGHPQVLRRFLPWLAIVPVALVAAYGGLTPFATLLIACDVVACWELARLIDPAAPMGLAAVQTAASVPWIVRAQVASSVPLTWTAGLVAVAFLVHVRLLRAPSWLRAVTLAAALGAGLSYWLALEQSQAGFAFVLVAFSVVAIHDVMAYAAGTLLRGYRPFPRLSAGKTLAGYAGGLIGALFVAYLLFFALPDFSWARRTAAGVVLAIAAGAGDLAASAVKRWYGAKDFGAALGPQGGLLDRLDSLLGAGCAFYWFVS